ncbi:MAG: type II secretion system F family protein [Coriobacteriia bacterium]|nr:type II secretion system F family protein [Coriobacteriia bacterium]
MSVIIDIGILDLGTILLTGALAGLAGGLITQVALSSQIAAGWKMQRTLRTLRDTHASQSVLKWAQNLEKRTGLHSVHLLVGVLMRRQKKQDIDEISRELPNMIDMITLSVSAGLSFDKALQSYAQQSDTILSRTFGQALTYWQTGLKLRSEALDDVASQLESEQVNRFVASIQQSLTLGTALVYALEAQGSEARAARKAYLETQIAKTPVKMLLPMAACILPSMLLLLLGPVVLDIMRGLGSGM